MIITISGTPGSGKSTIAKILVEQLKAQRIYVGGLRRGLAKVKGMTLAELNEYAKTHPETDVEVDKTAAAQARRLAQEGKTVIVEGRTQYHFLPESIKVYIKVDLDEGARRIWKDLQNKETNAERNEASVTTLEGVKKEIIAREEADAFRYKKYYRLDHRDESQYDLVIDTTKITAKEAAEQIKGFIEKRIAQRSKK